MTTWFAHMRLAMPTTNLHSRVATTERSLIHEQKSSSDFEPKP
jgi:hypothetical protein